MADMRCLEGENTRTTCTSVGMRPFKENTVIELNDLDNLVIAGDTQLKCRTRQQEQCDITIKLTKDAPTTLQLVAGASIQGQVIVVDSPQTAVYIDYHSRIVATAASYAYKGSYNTPDNKNEAARGASFVGQGGYCGTANPDYRIYGRFDMSNPGNVWDDACYQVGSMGQWTPVEKGTSGGAYIYMNVDSIDLEGDGSSTTLEADGWPQAASSKSGTYHGGSGGYIHIKTANVHTAENNKHQHHADKNQWLVSAAGGHGKNAGFGGAGGIIILDGNFEFLKSNYRAFGGTSGDQVTDSSDGCGTGAAGTVFFKQQDLLYVSNGNRKTNKVTQVTAEAGGY